MEIESTNFNLEQSDVTLKMSPAPREENSWGPICAENTWHTGNGYFSKVGDIFKKINGMEI